MSFDSWIMYEVSDTIVAVSSASRGPRAIIRITGPETLALCEQIFRPRISLTANGIVSGSVRIDDTLRVDAQLYVFFAPNSYTGESLAEIHLHASEAVTEAVVQSLLAGGLRPAASGEFTARAYLNGKLDLAQAEAVNEIIGSSNRLQLDAAEKLLSGRLTTAIKGIRSALLDGLSLIEAGLDFSGEDIEFPGGEQTVERLTHIETELDQLLAGSIRCESLSSLPAIGIAGAPNAGKSSLLNAILGQERSIVSQQPKTTRDVLSGLLRLSSCSGARRRSHTSNRSCFSGKQASESPDAPSAPQECVLFDCAGLILSPDNILDELAQRAAIEALRGSLAVIFCVDLAKPHWDEDIAVGKLIVARPPSAARKGSYGSDRTSAPVRRASGSPGGGGAGPGPAAMIYVATKSDLLGPEALSGKIEELTQAFGVKFLPVSSKTGHGLRNLDHLIRKTIRESTGPGAQHQVQRRRRSAPGPSSGPSASTVPHEEQSTIALTARHKHAVMEALDDVRGAVGEIGHGNEDIAAMMVRAAYRAISEIEQQPIDEEILERIFSRFCIGK